MAGRSVEPVPAARRRRSRWPRPVRARRSITVEKKAGDQFERHAARARRQAAAPGQRRRPAGPAAGARGHDVRHPRRRDPLLMSDGSSILLEPAARTSPAGTRSSLCRARKKIPVLKGWTDLRLSESDLPHHFNGTGNIGVARRAERLAGGRTSTARRRCAAPVPCRRRARCPGRPGKPASQLVVHLRGIKTRKHQDPVSKKMIVELRSTGRRPSSARASIPAGSRTTRRRRTRRGRRRGTWPPPSRRWPRP